MRNIIRHWAYRRLMGGAAVIGLLVALAACGGGDDPTATPTFTSPPPTATSTPTPTLAPGETRIPPTPTPTESGPPAWQLEWDRTLAAAKEEGSVVLTFGGSGEQRRTKLFQET